MPLISNYKVLCVDDEANILHMFQRTLGRRYVLFVADSAENALDILAEQADIGVIISDYNMPGMNGVEFLKRARQISPNTVQIMLTGNIQLDVSIKAINETDIFRYLPKPCPMSLLVKVVTDAMAQYALLIETKRLSMELELKNNALAASNAGLSEQKYLLEYELEMAKTVYAKVVFCQNKPINGLDFRLLSKDGVGGDFLLTCSCPDQQVFYFLLGDLTGHGLQSALAALLVAEGFQQQCTQQPEIAQLAAEINDNMCRKLPTGLFCAAILAKVDVRARQLDLWMGGMPDVYLLDEQGNVTQTWLSNNLPLGVLAGQDFTDTVSRHTSHNPESIFFYSDGVSEQIGADHSQFGCERLQAALKQCPHDVPRVDFVLTQLKQHQQQQDQADDISLLELDLLRLCPAMESL